MKKRKKKRVREAAPPEKSPGGLLSAWVPPAAAAAVVAVLMLAVLIAFYLKERYLEAVYFLAYGKFLLTLPRALWGGLARDLLLAGAMWFTLWCLGDALSRRLGAAGGRLERAMVSAGLGAGTASLALLALGIAGLWSVWALRGIFYAGCAASAAWTVHRVRARGEPLFSGEEPDGTAALRADAASEGAQDRGAAAAAARAADGPLSPWAWAALALMACVAVLNLMATTAPEVFYDSLVYHLSLPNLYLLRGGIVPTPESLYSGIPFGTEMLYGLALALSGEDLAVLLHCSFAMGAALGVWAWIRARSSRNAAVLGAFLFYMCPLVIYSSWQCGVDLAGAFYMTAAFLAVSRTLEGDSRGAAAAAGLLLGFMMSVKYTLVPAAGAFVLVHLWLRLRAGGAARPSLWMGAAAAAAFAPWLVKNIVFYGNPVYPFLSGLIGWTAPAEWKMFLGDARSRDLGAMFGTLSGIREYLSLPWAIGVESRDIDDWMGPMFLMSVPCALFLRWGIIRRREGLSPAWTAALVLGLAGYVIWSVSSGLVRFLVPMLPPLACAAALAFFEGPYPSWFRHAGWACLMLVSLFSFQSVFRGGGGGFMAKWSVVTGRLSKAEYLRTPRVSYGQPYYRAMEFMRGLPEDVKVLFVGESRGYYCERDFIAASVFDHNPLWVEVRKAEDASGVRDGLRALGVTHLFVNAHQLYAAKGYPAVLPRDVAESEVFEDFRRVFLKKVFEHRGRSDTGRVRGWLVVYELLDEPEETPLAEDPIRFLIDVLTREGDWR